MRSNGIFIKEEKNKIKWKKEKKTEKRRRRRRKKWTGEEITADKCFHMFHM